MKEEIHVENCHECPFCNNDNEYGRDTCNLKEIKLAKLEELPSHRRHEECPLSFTQYTIHGISNYICTDKDKVCPCRFEDNRCYYHLDCDGKLLKS